MQGSLVLLNIINSLSEFIHLFEWQCKWWSYSLVYSFIIEFSESCLCLIKCMEYSYECNVNASMTSASEDALTKVSYILIRAGVSEL